MSGEATPRRADLEKIAQLIEDLKNTEVAALGRKVNLLRDDLDKRLMELEGKVDAIGDWIETREAKSAPEMQRPAPAPKEVGGKQLSWQTAQGQKGPYEFVAKEQDWGLFERISKTEKGTMFEGGYFYWLRNTDGAICRKKTQPRGGGQ